MEIKTVNKPEPGTWYELPGLVPPLDTLCLTREFKKDGTRFQMAIYKSDKSGKPHFFDYHLQDKRGPIFPSAWMVSPFGGISKKVGDFL